MHLKYSLIPYILRRIMPVLALCFVSILPASAYTVVIDAGHGGKDHGAIDNNVREKDINLDVALKVEKLLRKQKNINVVLTRDKDVFLTLQQRADVANKAKGDLFVSIHTNSVATENPNRTTVAGASTYTLGLDKDAQNQAVAKRENSVITYENNYSTKYSGFDPESDESYIIFEMAQKANMAQSVQFAKAVQQQLAKTAGRRDRGVHQAGFWVLWATSMPSALIELDFICNPNSAKYLASEQGQDKLAEGIATAITDYFKTLQNHEKQRLRTNEAPEPEGKIKEGEGVVLEAAVPVEKKSIDGPGAVTPAERTRRPATRRRRSVAAREKSEQQEYEVAVIADQVNYVANEDITPEKSQVVAQSDSNASKNKSKQKKSNDKKQKTDNKKDQLRAAKNKTNQSKQTNNQAAAGSQGRVVTVNGKQVEVQSNAATQSSKQKTSNSHKDVASAPAAQSPANQKEIAAAANAKAAKTASKQQAVVNTKQGSQKATNKHIDEAHARLARVNTVYKIQFYSCDKILKEKDPVFAGLHPVTCARTGDDIYTYYYGESSNKGEIYRLLADVQKLFPEAKVVSARKQ